MTQGYVSGQTPCCDLATHSVCLCVCVCVWLYVWLYAWL